MTTYLRKLRKSIEFSVWRRIGEMPQAIRTPWQEYCLRNLLGKALRVPAYRALWHSLPFSPDAFSPKDLEKLPVIDKDFFRSRRFYECLRDDRIPNRLAVRYACDSSGQPVRYLQDFDYIPHLRVRLHRSKYAGYALPEFGLIAEQCPHYSGRHAYHVFEESLILEIADDNGVRLRDGVRGRIVVTYFENRYMPFVRYDTGELGLYSSKECPCGKKLFVPEVRKPSRAVIGDRILYRRDFHNVFRFYYGFVDRFDIETDGCELCVNIKAGRLWKEDHLPILTEQLRKVIGDRAIGIKIVVR